MRSFPALDAYEVYGVSRTVYCRFLRKSVIKVREKAILVSLSQRNDPSPVYAEENPNEYRILFLSVETLGKLKLTREDLQERNPAFRALFKCVERCIKAGVLQGDPFAVSTVLWTGAHGAAALMITAQRFPFGSRQLYAEEVVATILTGVQNPAIARV